MFARLARVTSAFACALSAAALLAACGSSATSSTAEEASVSRPAPPKSVFPNPDGRSLAEVVKGTSGPAEVVVSPAALVFYRGENRYPFGVFHNNRSQIADARVALYISKAPPPKARLEGPAAETKKQRKGAIARARHEALEAPAMGPFPASIETLETKPAFRADSTSDSPDAATVVYSADLDFPSDGEWRVAAVIEEESGKFTGAILPSAIVGEFTEIPRVGDPAPIIHTPTAAEAGGDLSKITTRVPPDTQNKVDFADVVGKEPIALLFATPQFCQSQVCGPVVDVAEQVKQTWGDKVNFIHMEIYNDNDPNNGVRPQVRAYHLPSEPWLFVIGRDGKIAGEVEGAFGVDLMTREIEKVAQ
ncbi:MAG TPA: hypothetical protein VGF09_09365 [Solirubrobacterales bacterium]